MRKIPIIPGIDSRNLVSKAWNKLKKEGKIPMTKTNHTPEPWLVDHENNLRTADAMSVIDTPENQRRIVACVNACQGVPTDQLEDLEPGSLTDSILIAIDRLNGYTE